MIQRMTAGSGIRHSEFNPSPDSAMHMLQIWIEPRGPGLTPEHESKAFPIREQPGRLHQLASPDGADGSLVIQQDARLHAGVLPTGTALEVALAPDRHAWIQVAHGHVHVNDLALEAGDGAAASNETTLKLEARADSEILLFDLA